jgi:hypothetical protein
MAFHAGLEQSTPPGSFTPDDLMAINVTCENKYFASARLTLDGNDPLDVQDRLKKNLQRVHPLQVPHCQRRISKEQVKK